MQINKDALCCSALPPVLWRLVKKHVLGELLSNEQRCLLLI